MDETPDRLDQGLVGVSYLKEGWGHLFLGQVRLDMVHGFLREGLRDTNTQCYMDVHKAGVKAQAERTPLEHKASDEMPLCFLAYGAVQKVNNRI